jgi:hypothetical protein
MRPHRRIAIIFDGNAWHVRRIRSIVHDLRHDEMVYRCDQTISDDHLMLADVPQIKALLLDQETASAVAEERKVCAALLAALEALIQLVPVPEDKVAGRQALAATRAARAHRA